MIGTKPDTERAWRKHKGEDVAELHSEAESYRRVLALRTPEGQHASVIVLRRRSSVWLTFDGALKTTVVLTNDDSGRLIEAVTEARDARR